MKSAKTKKMLSLSVNILVYLFLALAVVSLIVAIFSKSKGDGAVTIFGKQVRIVISDSMEKCDNVDVSAFDIKDIPVKSAVFIDTVPEDEEEAKAWFDAIEIGDVLTFKYLYTTQEVITHRVVTKEAKEGGYLIGLEGDNQPDGSVVLRQTIDTSNTNSPNYILGKVTAVSYPIGLVIYTLTQPVGIAILIMLPCFVIIVLEILRIVKYLNAEKKRQHEADSQKKDDEIEALKLQLEALRAQAAASDSTDSEAEK